MVHRTYSRPSTSHRRSNSGFTLIELAVVIVVVTVITSIALANFIRFQKRASYTSCASNQRHILEASTLYISQSNPGTVAFDVAVLTAGGWINLETASCPRSAMHAQNDYRIDIVNNDVNSIDCKILPAEHHWNLP